MRIAIIEVMGSLIKVVNGSGDGDNDNDSGNVSQVAGLIEAILDRMLDTSSYVRVKVLAVLNKLWMHDLKATLAKQRLNCTRFAVVALEDKVASVRKSAISLLVVLMQTHPWTKAFNGFLEQDAWENGFLAIKAEVAELEKKLVEAVGEQPAANAEGEDDDEDEDEYASCTFTSSFMNTNGRVLGRMKAWRSMPMVATIACLLMARRRM